MRNTLAWAVIRKESKVICPDYPFIDNARLSIWPTREQARYVRSSLETVKRCKITII